MFCTARWCCQGYSTFSSTGNYLYLRFVSDGSYTDTGFNAAVWGSTYFVKDACPGPAAVYMAAAYTEVALTPTQYYDNNMDCGVIIQSPSLLPVTITFVSLDTEPCCDHGESMQGWRPQPLRF